MKKQQSRKQRSSSIFVLVRHGESEWNALGKWTGWEDIVLSDKGREEARRAAREIATISFHHAFTSDLKRAQETLKIIKHELGYPDLKTTIESAFKERHYGIYTGLVKWEIKAKIGEEKFKRLRRGWNEPISGGETLKDVHSRVVPAYKKHILPLISQGKNVLFVAHGNSVRALVKHLETIPDELISEFELATGEIMMYTLSATGKVVKKEKRVTNRQLSYIQRVHDFVKTIPAGKVVTYGQIATVVGIDPRMVGWALHANNSSEVPCHRVVNKDGRLAPNFAFDGWKEQQRRLMVEGVTFKDEMHVDLARHQINSKFEARNSFLILKT